MRPPKANLSTVRHSDSAGHDSPPSFCLSAQRDPRGQGAAPQAPRASPRRPRLYRAGTKRPRPAYSPRQTEGPSSGQSLSRPCHRLCCGRPMLPISPFPGSLLAQSAWAAGGPLAAEPLVFQSKSPLGHQPAIAEPMPSLLPPPKQGAPTNPGRPCCGVPRA